MPNTAASFEPGSTITLCKVMFDAAYSDVVDWPSQANLESYFSSLSSSSVEFVDSTYMPVGSPVVVDLPYSVAYAYNYCYVTNPPQLTSEPEAKTYYYFITSCRYNNPASVTLTLQLDVWTTYRFDVTFGYGYLEQGHLAQANSASLQDGIIPTALRSYLTVPEGIDTGSEFVTVKEDMYSLQAGPNDETATPDSVVIISTADLSTSFGTISNPNLTTASGGVSGGLYNGCNVYVTDRAGFVFFLNAIKQYSWVAQCIVSITALPYLIVQRLNLIDSDFNGSDPDWMFKTMASTIDSKIQVSEDGIDIAGVSGNGWYGYDVSDLRKLWTYPYSVIEVTTWDGSSVFLKPELLNDNENPLMAIFCSVPPFARVGFYVSKYARGAGPDTATVKAANGAASFNFVIPTGDFLDSSVWISEFPQFSIVNNNYMVYMASTANRRAYSYQSAEWSLASASRSQVTAYDNAMETISTNAENTRVGIENDAANRNIENVTRSIDIAAGAVGDIASLNIGGAIGGVVSGVNNLIGQNMQFANNQALANTVLANTTTLATDTANRNNQLAQYVNQGNYRNAIASIDAGISDAALTPPSTIGQMGGEGFRYAIGLLFGCTVRYKRIPPNALARVAQYFRRFGYQVHRYVQVPQGRLNVCQYFSYYKFSEIHITAANANETEKDAIRGIFMKGVTLWEDARQIGTIDVMANKVRTARISNYYM